MALDSNHTSWNVENTTAQEYGEHENNWTEDSSRIEVYLLMAMLSLFAVVGAFGNTVVLYGFSRMLRQNLTSTVFILTLAGTDLLTAVLIIPYTVYMEFVAFYVDPDPVCKSYHFLITSTVPYSIFLMVVIAVDRYLCICRPFQHVMNLKRAKFVVVFFAAVSVILGATISLFYGVYARPTVNITDVLNVTEIFPASHGNMSISLNENETYFSMEYHSYFEEIANYSNVSQSVMTDKSAESYVSLTFTGLCDKNDLVFPEGFQKGFQLCYSFLFLIAVIIVGILYTCIFVVVTKRRKKTQKIRSTNSVMYNCNGNSSHRRESVFAQLTQRKRRSSNQESTRRSSRRSERAFVANLRTALTLFIVTVVFIIVFLPGWLMALRIVRFNLFLFYLHLIHCVANPFIYAFMNETFRRVLKKLFACKPTGSGFAVIGGMSQTTC